MNRPYALVPRPGSPLTRCVFAAALAVVAIGAVIDPGVTPVAGLNDKVQHVLAFAGISLLACMAMPRRSRWRWLLPVLLAYGLSIECVQWWLPWREFSLLDLAADLAGIVIGLGGLALWGRVQGATRG